MVRVDRRKVATSTHDLDEARTQSSTIDQRALNAQLAHAHDRAALHQLILTHSATFNAVNCATALHRLAKCAPAVATQLAATDAHWKKSWALAAKATSAEATSADEDAKVEALLCCRCATVLEAGSEDVSARSLTSIAWATGKLKLGHGPLRAALTSQALLQCACGGLDAFGIANIAWALATLHSAERVTSLATLSETHRQTPSCATNRQTLTSATNAPMGPPADAHGRHLDGSGRHTDASDRLLDALAKAATVGSTIDEFKPQELCNLVWAFATLRRPCATLFDAAARSACKQLSNFSAQGLSQTLWAYAKLGHAQPALFLAAAGVALPRLHAYDAQSISTLAWAFGSAEVEHPELLAGLSAEVIARPAVFDAASCARLLWALARLTQGVDPQAVTTLSARLTRVAGESLQSKPMLDALGALATLKSGSGRGGGAALATLLCEAACKAAPTLSASKLGITAWALSRPAVHNQLPYRARSAWKAALRSATLRVADDLSWRCVGHIEAALRAMQSSAGGGGGGSSGGGGDGGGGGGESGGGCDGFGGAINGERDPVAVVLGEAASRSMLASNTKSILRNDAPARLLLATRPWVAQAALPGPVLLVGFEQGGVTKLLEDALLDSGLTPVHWRRFASSRHDADSSAWPRGPGKAGEVGSHSDYVATLVRWSWYAAGDAALMMIHACASVTVADTPLWLCGNDAEGVAAAADLLTQAYGEASQLQAGDGCRVYAAARGSAGEAAAASARGSLAGWVTQSTLTLPPHPVTARGGVGQKRAKPEAASDGGGNRKARKRAASRLRQKPEAEAEPEPSAPPTELRWHTFPGLFAGGGLDVMTRALLSRLPTPPPGARVLDACCGSGTIAAALRHAPGGDALRLHMLDADAVAIHAAKAVNVADAERHFLCASWPHTPSAFPSTGKPKRYDWIVSNPPVHHGQPDDFRVVEELVRGARKRLKRDGVLWIVAQEQVPIGRVLALHGTFARVHADVVPPDGRFVVWSASGRTGK